MPKTASDVLEEQKNGAKQDYVYDIMTDLFFTKEEWRAKMPKNDSHETGDA